MYWPRHLGIWGFAAGVIGIEALLGGRALADPIPLGKAVSLSSLPAGWSLADSAVPDVFQAEKPPTLPRLLVAARPDAAGSSSYLSIAQTLARPNAAGPLFTVTPLAEALNLANTAAGLGWRSNSLKVSSNRVAGYAIQMVTLEASNGGQAKRRFVGLTIAQATESTRFIFQAAPEDEKATADLQALLDRVLIDDQPVSAALATAAPVAFSELSGAAATRLAGREGAPGLPPNLFGSEQSPAQAGAGGTASGAEGGLDEAANLTQTHRGALVIIEGKKGRGSGFLCHLGNATYLVTNAHVLSDNPSPSFTTLEGVALKVGAGAVAIGHDMLRLQVSEAPAAVFEPLPQPDGKMKIGDAVAVLGNSEGAGVVRALRGHIVGIGPNLVEVDAPFVPGNSGSPIIHVPTGKVIGIATYLIEKKVGEAGGTAVSTNVRRFGFRLDSAKQWQPLSWPVFDAQAQVVERIEESGNEFSRLLKRFHSEEALRAADYQNPNLRRAVLNFTAALGHSHASQQDVTAAERRLVSDLRSATMSDIKGFDAGHAYEYFQHRVQEETKFREALYQAFSKAINYYD